MSLTIEDLKVMRPSDALAKAVEMLPEVRWFWGTALGNPCCAIGMLMKATKIDACPWELAAQIYTSLGAVRISVSTVSARSFPEAIAMLREHGL